MKGLYKDRIKKIRKLFENLPGSAALLVSAAPAVIKSRDTNFSYRPSSDLYYLTGSKDDRITLLISSLSKDPIIFSPPHDAHKAIWEGVHTSPKKIAASIGAELIITTDLSREISRKVQRIETLYYSSIHGGVAAKYAKYLFELPSHSRTSLPRILADSDVLMERLRLYKSQAEVKLIEQSNKITAQSLIAALPLIKPGATEAQIANQIDFEFAKRGAEVGFNSIVATGPSAAVLHYEARTRKLRRGEMLLVDIGAQYQMYCADMTRVLPVSGNFTALQRKLYETVLRSQRAAIREIRHGALVKNVYNAAARELTAGLKDLGILRGSVPKLFSKQAYKPFFMHGIGHSLGLDVHDIGNLRANEDARLEEGMVFTVEPGLYFPKRTRTLAPCGVRIEDNVLVTKRGARVLSHYFPSEISELEELIAG